MVDLVQALKDGTISPQDAIEQFEFPARHLSRVKVSLDPVDILSTGFPSFDNMMLLKRNRGELIIFGARPSQGKSAMLFQLARNVAKHDNVLIYSMEMDAESIKARMVAAESGVSLEQIFRGVSKHKMDAFNAGLARLDKLKFFVDDRSGIDVRTLRASALAHAARHPLSLIVVDYLQLLKTQSRNSRNEEVGDLTLELKSLAKELKCPVIVASQLNRECEKRGKLNGDYMPIMSDLRDSGNIEQDADIILFLNRPEVYDGTRPGEADVQCAKNRNGKLAMVKFRFLGGQVAFQDMGASQTANNREATKYGLNPEDIC